MVPSLASRWIISYNDIVKNTPPMGPTPTPPPAEPSGAPLDAARGRLLRLLAGRSATTSPTVDDLVAAVGGHPNTTRHHLRALVAAGLVEVERTPPAGGRGRPATRYAVTRSGRDAAAPGRHGAAAAEYVALAAAFAERLAERGGDPGADARAIGKAWGAGLVARDEAVVDDGQAAHTVVDDSTDPSTSDRVIGLLDRLGFSPAVEQTARARRDRRHRHPRDGRHPARRTVLLRTCPLLDAARRHPEVVCEVHLGLVAGALEALDEPSEDLRLEPFARPGACVLALPRHTGGVSTDDSVGVTGDVTVVVLAGGTSRRFGSDKLAAPLRGSTVLDTVVASLPPHWPVVVVGPPRDCGRPVAWTREDPPGAARSPGSPQASLASRPTSWSSSRGTCRMPVPRSSRSPPRCARRPPRSTPWSPPTTTAWPTRCSRPTASPPCVQGRRRARRRPPGQAAARAGPRRGRGAGARRPRRRHAGRPRGAARPPVTWWPGRDGVPCPGADDGAPLVGATRHPGHGNGPVVQGRRGRGPRGLSRASGRRVGRTATT